MAAQNAKPESDSSNSSNNSGQMQSGATTPGQKPENRGVPTMPSTGKSGSNTTIPSTTIHDQQSSTTSTTGASGDNANPPQSTMGTTGSTPATADHAQPQNGTRTLPGDTNTSSPVDQQPNSSTSPTPQAAGATPSGTSNPVSSAKEALIKPGFERDGLQTVRKYRKIIPALAAEGLAVTCSEFPQGINQRFGWNSAASQSSACA